MNLRGRRFGSLVVVRDLAEGSRRRVAVRCDCGAEVLVIAANLLSGNSTSCHRLGCKERRNFEAVQ